MSLNIPATTRKRVVVIGGGFGGMKLIDSLRRSGFQRVLIDQNNYHSRPEPRLYCFSFPKRFPAYTGFSFPHGPGHPDRSPGKSDRNDDR